MTVAALPAIANYLENGVTLAFAAPFRFEAADIRVRRILADGTVVQLAQGPDFSVAGGASDAGGEVTLSASVGGARLRIRRATPRQQPVVYTPGGRFPAEVNEQAHDRTIKIVQEQDAAIDDTASRALMLPEGEVAADLPAAVSRANRWLGFDAGGGVLAASASTVAMALADPLAPLLSFINKGDPGPAGNVAADLAQLKAAAISNVTMLYRKAPFTFTLGDYTGQDDDIKIVASDHEPLTTGAWVRQETTSITAIASNGSDQSFPLDEYLGNEMINARNFAGIVGDTTDETARWEYLLLNAPLGSTIYVPPFDGAYSLVTDQLNQTKPLNFIFAQDALLIGAFDDPTKYLWNVRISEGGAFGEARGMFFINPLMEIAFGTDAKGCMNLESQDGVDLPLFQVRLQGGHIFMPIAATGLSAIRMAGLTSQLHEIVGCTIQGAVYWDRCADGCRVRDCTMLGHKPSLFNPKNGAFRHAFTDNIVVSRDGGLQIYGGGQIVVERNQFETAGNYTVNVGLYTSSLVIFASFESIRGVTIGENNFGANTLGKCGCNITVAATAPLTVEDVIVRKDNTMLLGTICDVRILDVRCKVDFEGTPRLRGERSGLVFSPYPVMEANLANPRDLFVVIDNGTGTSWIKQPATKMGGASDTALQNGWACHADYRFWRTYYDSKLHMGRTWTAPADPTTTNKQVGVLPDGYAPATDQIVRCEAPASSLKYAVFKITGTTGVIECLEADAGAVIYTEGFHGVELPDRVGYQPSY